MCLVLLLTCKSYPISVHESQFHICRKGIFVTSHHRFIAFSVTDFRKLLILRCGKLPAAPIMCRCFSRGNAIAIIAYSNCEIDLITLSGETSETRSALSITGNNACHAAFDVDKSSELIVLFALSDGTKCSMSYACGSISLLNKNQDERIALKLSHLMKLDAGEHEDICVNCEQNTLSILHKEKSGERCWSQWTSKRICLDANTISVTEKSVVKFSNDGDALVVTDDMGNMEVWRMDGRKHITSYQNTPSNIFYSRVNNEELYIFHLSNTDKGEFPAVIFKSLILQPSSCPESNTTLLAFGDDEEQLSIYDYLSECYRAHHTVNWSIIIPVIVSGSFSLGVCPETLELALTEDRCLNLTILAADNVFFVDGISCC